MTRTKILTGIAIVASLLSYAPIAEAAPIAPSRAVITSTDGSVMRDVTRVVVVVRHRAVVRRPVRRVVR